MSIILQLFEATVERAIQISSTIFFVKREEKKKSSLHVWEPLLYHFLWAYIFTEEMNLVYVTGK